MTCVSGLLGSGSRDSTPALKTEVAVMEVASGWQPGTLNDPLPKTKPCFVIPLSMIPGTGMEWTSRVEGRPQEP